MPVVTLVSAKGSPGVTTAAAALTAAASLQGRALLVELDPSGGDVQVLTGVVDEPGVVLAAGELRRDVSAGSILGHVTTAPPEVPVLLAPTASLMAASVIGSVIDRWRPALHDHGGTVFVDAGRWEASQPTARRAAVGDLVAVVCRPSLASVEHARQMVDRLRQAARRPVVALVVGEKPYSPVEVAAQLEVPLGGAIAWDPRGVATLWSKGVVRSWGRTWLASTAADSVASLVALVPEAVMAERAPAPRPVDTGATPAVTAPPAASGPPLGRPIGPAGAPAATAPASAMPAVGNSTAAAPSPRMPTTSPPAAGPIPGAPGTGSAVSTAGAPTPGTPPPGMPATGGPTAATVPAAGGRPGARPAAPGAASRGPSASGLPVHGSRGPRDAVPLPGEGPAAPTSRTRAVAPRGATPGGATLLDDASGRAPAVREAVTGEPPAMRPGDAPLVAGAPRPAAAPNLAGPLPAAPATPRPAPARSPLHDPAPGAPGATSGRVSPAAPAAVGESGEADARAATGAGAVPADGRSENVDARPGGVVAAGPGAAPAGGGYVPAAAARPPTPPASPGRGEPTVVWAGQVPDDRPGRPDDRLGRSDSRPGPGEYDARAACAVAPAGRQDQAASAGDDRGRRADTGPIGAVVPEPTTRLGRAKQRRARRGEAPPPPPFDWAESDAAGSPAGEPGDPTHAAAGDHTGRSGRADRAASAAHRSAVPPYGPPPPPAPPDAPANAPGARRARHDDRAGGR